MNLFKNNNEKITRVLMTLKLVLGSLAVSTYVSNNSTVGFYMLVATGVLDVVVSAFSSDDKKNGE
jgi:hypothetical protein